jgi:hypothetical protein
LYRRLGGFRAGLDEVAKREKNPFPAKAKKRIPVLQSVK